MSDVQRFEYRQACDAGSVATCVDVLPLHRSDADASRPLGEEDRLRLELERARLREEQALERGRREGEQRARDAAAHAVEQERGRTARMIGEFERQRDRYFREVESQAVALALAIAARILHREVRMDPLLLAGVVRVALDRLVDTEEVELHVPVAEIAAWQEYFRIMTDVRRPPAVVGDPRLASGDCVLETRLGTIELGIEPQLQEIERGFFDLLEKRPPSTAQLFA